MNGQLTFLEKDTIFIISNGQQTTGKKAHSWEGVPLMMMRTKILVRFWEKFHLIWR